MLYNYIVQLYHNARCKKRNNNDLSFYSPYLEKALEMLCFASAGETEDTALLTCLLTPS